MVPTIVCESGLGLSRFMWSRIIPPLVCAGTRVVVYDRAGMGHSPFAIHERNIDNLTGDLQSVIEKTAPQGAIGVGHSYGGLIVRNLADSCPHLVKAIVLVDPSTEKVLTETTPIFRFLDAIIQKVMEGIYALGAGPLVVLGMGYWRLPKPIRKQALRTDGAYFAAKSRKFELNDYAKTLSTLAENPLKPPAIPVILVAAKASAKAATTQAYTHFVNSIPGAKLTWARTNSHMVPIVDPRSVIEAIRWATCRAYCHGSTCECPSDNPR